MSLSADSTTATSPSVAVAVPAILTTPFVQASSCRDVFTTTSIAYSGPQIDFSITTVQVAVSPDYATCQPPGRASLGAQSRFFFSPAVCPSGWTASYLQASVTDDVLPTHAVSTAYCCSSGYQLKWEDADLSIDSIARPACFSSAGGAETSPFGTPFAGLHVHNAWHIAWASSDLSTLSPSPPPLPTSEYLDSWVPGATIHSPAAPSANGNGNYSNVPAPNDSPLGYSAIWAAAVGVPLFIFLLITFCCICAIRGRRKEREAEVAYGLVRRQAEMDAAAAAQALAREEAGAAKAAATQKA